MLFKKLAFTESKILTIGDLMLDEYWIGKANRISPEAPVPIVLVDHKDYKAGGAANVALNIAGLGSSVDLMGIIGEDFSGKTLQTIITQQPKIKNHFYIQNNYPTINKLRIISNDQQLFRLDQEKKFTVSHFEQLVAKFKDIISTSTYHAMVLSDYDKGSLQDPQIFINLASKFKIPTIIDPKNINTNLYKNASILTPNLKEFEQMVKITNLQDAPAINLAEIGHNLIKILNLQALVITKGKQGLTLLTNDYKDQDFPAYSREVFDVTGAGDTVIATIAVALANNYSLQEAAHLATVAAGIAVSKLGTYWVSSSEINQELNYIEQQTYTNKLNLGIIKEEALIPIIASRKSLGEKIVLVNGCFDVLHAGHIQYLEKAKSYGDRLIVAVNDDDSIKILKGNDRPINKLAHRMEVLAGLKAVDWVVAFGDQTEIRPGRIISRLNPDILIKSKENFQTIEEIPVHEGGPHVINNGGKIYLLDRPLVPDCMISSTKIIENIKKININEATAHE